MKMKMFATLDKANPDTVNIRGFNLADGKAYDGSSEQTAVVAGAINNRASCVVLNLD
jgi:hypothetical protein